MPDPVIRRQIGLVPPGTCGHRRELERSCDPCVHPAAQRVGYGKAGRLRLHAVRDCRSGFCSRQSVHGLSTLWVQVHHAVDCL